MHYHKGMGFFWTPLEQKWIPRPRWPRTHGQQRRVTRREKLLRELIAEIQDGSTRQPRFALQEDAEAFVFMQRNARAAKLYAALLARALVGTDEMLMKEWGNQIAELTAGGEKVAK
jgi:hypothetical protein